MLWTASAYLLEEKKRHWITTVPALFMSTVVISFVLSSATLGFGLPMPISTATAFLAATLMARCLVVRAGKAVVPVEKGTEVGQTV